MGSSHRLLTNLEAFLFLRFQPLPPLRGKQCQQEDPEATQCLVCLGELCCNITDIIAESRIIHVRTIPHLLYNKEQNVHCHTSGQTTGSQLEKMMAESTVDLNTLPKMTIARFIIIILKGWVFSFKKRILCELPWQSSGWYQPLLVQVLIPGQGTRILTHGTCPMARPKRKKKAVIHYT